MASKIQNTTAAAVEFRILVLNKKLVSPPSPSPASAKVSCQGGNKLEKLYFYDFYIKNRKKTTRGLKKGFSAKKWEKYKNYSSRFPEGVQKEEIQLWRQAQSRPGEKETHNIKLMEKSQTNPLKKWLAVEL